MGQQFLRLLNCLALPPVIFIFSLESFEAPVNDSDMTGFIRCSGKDTASQRLFFNLSKVQTTHQFLYGVYR